jgi:histidinol-phosphate aminotransferase
MKIEDLVNPHIRELQPYEPGKPIEEVERELGISSSVKLASNENPNGPSPRAVEAILAAVAGIHRYPDGANFALRRRLAEYLAVGEEQLIFGAGADEVLELLVKTFLSPGDEAVMAWPSFAMYPIVTMGMGGIPMRIPLDGDLQHDLPAMARAVGEQTKIVFLCNPNNPTGTSFGAGALNDFIATIPEHVVLVIDEAYGEFVRREDFPDSLALLEARPATIVLRTFSKIDGLAGLRVGYGVGSPELIGFLERARHPFNVNQLAEAAALAAIDDEEHRGRTRELNAKGIEYLTAELVALGFEVWPSDANFILVKTGMGYYEALLERGVIVRPMTGFGLPECIRISIGTVEENEKFVLAMNSVHRLRATPGAEALP